MLVGTNIITTIYSFLIAAGFSRGSLHFLLIVANVASNVAVIMMSCVKSAVVVVVGVVGTIVIFTDRTTSPCVYPHYEYCHYHCDHSRYCGYRGASLLSQNGLNYTLNDQSSPKAVYSMAIGPKSQKLQFLGGRLQGVGFRFRV